jgi:hypothetical protein
LKSDDLDLALGYLERAAQKKGGGRPLAELPEYREPHMCGLEPFLKAFNYGDPVEKWQWRHPTDAVVRLSNSESGELS